MDEIDVNLIEAWDRVWLRCEADPAEAAKRFERVRSGIFARPPRAWCMAIRASDTRLTRHAAWIDDLDAMAERRAHRVTVGSETIKALCKPVWISWPGVKQCEAAAMLGKHRNALDRWLPVRAGRTRADRERFQPRRWEEICDPNWPLCVRFEPARPHGHRGYDVPVVWSARPLDPGACNGSPPHPVWGSMWERHCERMPWGFGQTIEREPRVLPRRGKRVFAGWWWRCPGRVDERGEPMGCGRQALMLYAPLPVWGAGQFLNMDRGLKVTGEANGPMNLAGEWEPGWFDPLAGRRSLACEHCWGVRRLSMTSYRGWNEFVTYISGGLLYGRDVKRPDWVTIGEAARKQRRSRRRVERETLPMDRRAEVA
jgi:hypothetical protein